MDWPGESIIIKTQNEILVISEISLGMVPSNALEYAAKKARLGDEGKLLMGPLSWFCSAANRDRLRIFDKSGNGSVNAYWLSQVQPVM